MSMACIFCQIVEGKRPAHKIYEDDLVVAFLDAIATGIIDKLMTSGSTEN